MGSTADAITRQWFKEVWDEGREEAIDRLAHAEVKAHGLSATEMIGTEAFKQVFQAFRDALGDLEIKVERTVTEGDTCAAYCIVKGRHVGKAFGGTPTNQPVEFAGIAICKVQNGRIVEAWNCFDFLTMYQQIGWVKNPPLP
jgi:steroid delta-isomerase-like uncharacterized protein